VSGSRVEFDSLCGLVNLWLEFLEQVNDLLSSFMTLVFGPTAVIWRPHGKTRAGGPSEYAAKRALL
jgi:hypothetical protein